MKIALYLQWWEEFGTKHVRMHESLLFGPCDLAELEVLFKYGSEWQNKIEMPITVNHPTRVMLTFVKVE
jgi:hypothetical protein